MTGIIAAAALIPKRSETFKLYWGFDGRQQGVMK